VLLSWRRTVLKKITFLLGFRGKKQENAVFFKDRSQLI
jgi:hypothetical protein